MMDLFPFAGRAGVALRAGRGMAALAASAGFAGSVMGQDAGSREGSCRSAPLPVGLRHVDVLAVTRHGVVPGGVVPGGAADGCIRESNYTAFSFQQGSSVTANAQGGFGEQEVAAVSYQLTAADFPLKLNTAEVLFATSNAAVATTTQWSVLIWSGPPTGTPVELYSSDGTILPHLVMPAGSNGTVIAFLVDPQDPEQIIVQDDGTHMLSVGFRVDHHHNQTQDPCVTEPSSAFNAFPATDVDGLAQPQRNWLWGLNCGLGPLNCPPMPLFSTAPGAWGRFGVMGSLCRPTGDWLIRATWQPLSCAPGIGACCRHDGTCELMVATACASGGGTYRGDGSECATADCPQPSAACCFSNGTCLNRTEASCGSLGGTWLGAGNNCNGSSCPTGACCFGDGTCAGGLTSPACVAQGGVFKGAGTSCGAGTCPQPTGACCAAGGGCDLLTQSDCTLIGGTWQGMGSACGSCAAPGCYVNCDLSTSAPVLNVADFTCFLQKFAQEDLYANCDLSTSAPVLNVADFTCFLQGFAAGCP